jgi:tetratricopeptide (TPR) repeat protein
VERILQKSQQSVLISETDKLLTARDPQSLHDLAQRLIEESLITPGNRRNSVVDDTLLDEYDVTVDFLDTLVDKSRLLRKEPRLDDFYYEIGHDTLLPAVIESRNRRREKEKSDLEKAAYEARLSEEAKRREAIEGELKTARKQRKLARMVALTSFASLLVSVAFGIWFTIDYIRSSRDQLKTAEDNVYIEQYDAAINGYEDLQIHPRRRWVLSHSDPPKEVEEERAVAELLHASFTATTDSLQSADSLMFTDNYAHALMTYRHTISGLELYKKQVLDNPRTMPKGVLAPRVDTNSINRQLSLLDKRKDNALKTLIREFKISQRDYEVFTEAKVWGQALRNLQRMQNLLPQHPKDLEALRDALQLNMPIDRYLEAKLGECRRELGR